MILKIGLTGGIGSGKTLVAGIFQVMGIPVFDADAAAKEIMEKDESIASEIRKNFGDSAYNGSNLDRAYLASKVFRDQYLLDKLNAIVHPATIEAADRWMEQQDAPYAVKEAALIFEAGSASHLDYVIGVTSPKSLRIKRVMDRSELSREDVIERMSRQVDDVIKMRLCDFVITNDEQQMVIPQVLEIHRILLEQIEVQKLKHPVIS